MTTSKFKTTSKMKMTSKMGMSSIMKTPPKIDTSNNVGYILFYLKELLMTPFLGSYSTADHKPEMLSAVCTGNRIPCD